MIQTLYGAAQGLGVACEKVSRFVQVIYYIFQDLIFCGLVEINHDIPAKDQVEFSSEGVLCCQ